MYHVVSRLECDRAGWNVAADTFPQAWAWHRSELLSARESWSFTGDVSFCVRENSSNGPIVALVPLVHIKAKSAQVFLGGHLESTGGPAIDPKLPRRSQKKVQDLIRDTINDLAKRMRVRRVDFSCAPLAPDLRSIGSPVPNPLCYFDVKDASTQSWVLEINESSAEELWNGLEHRSRKQIKKAEKNGLTAEVVVPNLSLLDNYYELHLENCRRNSLPSHPAAYFRSIFEDVAKAGLCKSCIVRDSNRILTIQNFLVYKNAAIYWTVASHADALTLCANDYGMWKSIQHHREAGLSYLECGEAFPSAREGKLRGLNDFKRSFGGRLYPYYRGTRVYRPVLEGALGVMRHFRSGGAAT